jgi:aryl sulfotransferase
VSAAGDDAEIRFPRKTRDLQNCMMDSTRWDGFRFRDGDIVIGTWAKSGTTWMQQIVSQLLFAGADDVPAMDLAPWLDMRCMPLDEVMAGLEAQTHRRFVKTHLPADALRMSPQARYIYIARDGRDVVWSWYNHLMKMTDGFYDLINDAPGRIGPPISRPTVDIRTFFHEWLDSDSNALGPYWPHIQSWWEIREWPNVLLVHFNSLKADMETGIRRIARFLGIDIDAARWPAIVEHCSFDYMKKNGDKLSTFGNDFFAGGLSSGFINKGTNGRWRDVLSEDESRKYENVAASRLTPDCARWLATGELTKPRAEPLIA